MSARSDHIMGGVWVRQFSARTRLQIEHGPPERSGKIGFVATTLGALGALAAGFGEAFFAAFFASFSAGSVTVCGEVGAGGGSWTTRAVFFLSLGGIVPPRGTGVRPDPCGRLWQTTAAPGRIVVFLMNEVGACFFSPHELCLLPR